MSHSFYSYIAHWVAGMWSIIIVIIINRLTVSSGSHLINKWPVWISFPLQVMPDQTMSLDDFYCLSFFLLLFFTSNLKMNTTVVCRRTRFMCCTVCVWAMPTMSYSNMLTTIKSTVWSPGERQSCINKNALLIVSMRSDFITCVITFSSACAISKTRQEPGKIRSHQTIFESNIKRRQYYSFNIVYSNCWEPQMENTTNRRLNEFVKIWTFKMDWSCSIETIST